MFIALISLWSFLLLIKTKFVVSGSFGGMFSGAIRDLPIDSHSFRYRRSAIWSIYAHRYPKFYHHFPAGFRFCLYNLCGGEFESWSFTTLPLFEIFTSFIGFRHGCHELHDGHSCPVFHPDAARYFPAVRPDP